MPETWEPDWDEKARRWKVDFSIEGRRVRRRLGIRDKGLKALARAEARLLYRREWQSHLDRLANPAPARSAPCFWEAAKGYVDAGGEARFLPRLIAHFGPELTIDEIGEPELTAAALELYPRAAPDTHRRQVRVPVSAVIRWARGERRRPSTDVRRTDWLTPEEVERLLQAADPATAAKIGFLVGTGARPGEMLAAEVRDWNPATRQLWISGEETGAGKTPLAARFVRLPGRSVALLGDLPHVGRMFVTPKGKPYVLRRNGGGQIKAAFDKAVARADLGRHITPYILRHTWATWFYAATRDFGQLLDLGGWAKADMANRYRKMAPDDLEERVLAHDWVFSDRTRERQAGAPKDEFGKILATRANANRNHL